MTADVSVKQHDTRPAIVATLTQTTAGASGAIDLTTATTVKLLLKTPDGTLTASRAAAITTPASGIVTVTLQAADTASAGTYNGEFEITWGDGGIQTVPNDSYFTVAIVADLG